MKKRGLSMLLALVMILSLTAPALAAEDAFEAEEPAVQEEVFTAPEEPIAPEALPVEEAPVEEPVSEPQPVEPIADEPAAVAVDVPMEAEIIDPSKDWLTITVDGQPASDGVVVQTGSMRLENSFCYVLILQGKYSIKTVTDGVTTADDYYSCYGSIAGKQYGSDEPYHIYTLALSTREPSAITVDLEESGTPAETKQITYDASATDELLPKKPQKFVPGDTITFELHGENKSLHIEGMYAHTWYNNEGEGIYWYGVDTLPDADGLQVSVLDQLKIETSYDGTDDPFISCPESAGVGEEVTVNVKRGYKLELTGAESVSDYRGMPRCYLAYSPETDYAVSYTIRVTAKEGPVSVKAITDKAVYKLTWDDGVTAVSQSFRYYDGQGAATKERIFYAPTDLYLCDLTQTFDVTVGSGYTIIADENSGYSCRPIGDGQYVIDPDLTRFAEPGSQLDIKTKKSATIQIKFDGDCRKLFTSFTGEDGRSLDTGSTVAEGERMTFVLADNCTYGWRIVGKGEPHLERDISGRYSFYISDAADGTVVVFSAAQKNTPYTLTIDSGDFGIQNVIRSITCNSEPIEYDGSAVQFYAEAGDQLYITVGKDYALNADNAELVYKSFLPVSSTEVAINYCFELGEETSVTVHVTENTPIKINVDGGVKALYKDNGTKTPLDKQGEPDAYYYSLYDYEIASSTIICELTDSSYILCISDEYSYSVDESGTISLDLHLYDPADEITIKTKKLDENSSVKVSFAGETENGFSEAMYTFSSGEGDGSEFYSGPLTSAGGTIPKGANVNIVLNDGYKLQGDYAIPEANLDTESGKFFRRYYVENITEATTFTIEQGETAAENPIKVEVHDENGYLRPYVPNYILPGESITVLIAKEAMLEVEGGDAVAKEEEGNSVVYPVIITPHEGVDTLTITTSLKPTPTPEPSASPAPTATPYDPPSYIPDPDPTATPEPSTSPEPGTTPEPGPSASPAPTPVTPPASGEGWAQNANGDWFYYENGAPVSNQWAQDGSATTYLGDDGKMVSGLVTVDDGTARDGTYYFSEKHDGTFGAMVTGWRQVGGDWYFFNDQRGDDRGKMVSNQWQADGDTWNHLGADGKMQTGLVEVNDGRSDDGWYYLNPKHDGTFGTMLTGWRQVGSDWYFFNDKHDGTFGRMIHNQWRADGDTWNYLGDDGKMVTGLRWVKDGNSYDGLYYLNPFHDGTFGTMLVSWQSIGGHKYYFETKHNGRYGIGYVNGTFTIDGKSYTFDAEGRLIDG